MTTPDPTYDGAGSVYALGMRVTVLNQAGGFATGPRAMYVSDALVRIDFTLNYSDPDEITRTSGAGKVCLRHQAPPQVTGLSIDAFEICSEDPMLEQMLSGGVVFENGAGAPIGYQAPQVGADPTPNGVAVEAFSAAILDGEYAPDLPYMHWAFPRLRLRQTGRSLQNDALGPTFEGTGSQNPNFGDGPAGDFDQDSTAVYQWFRVPGIPAPTGGWVAVPGA
jgi:hypothetical protein